MKKAYVNFTKSVDRLETVLTTCHYLTMEQAYKVNFHGHYANAAIKNLEHIGVAFKSNNEKYLLAFPWAKPYKQRIMAIDVILENIVNIHVRDIYLPSEDDSKDMLIGFVKNQKAYELFAAFNKQELDNLIVVLNKRWAEYAAENNMENLDNMRYLIIVKNEDLLMYLPDADEVKFKGAYVLVENPGQANSCISYYNPYAIISDEEMESTLDENKLDEGVIVIDGEDSGQ